MHVHVAVDSDEQGVAVIDRIAPWLPVLVAISANSPFNEGEDTGYASWRNESWGRWPSAAGTEQFGSLAGYRDACRYLMDPAPPSTRGCSTSRPGSRRTTRRWRCGSPTCAPITEDALLVAALVRGAGRDGRGGRRRGSRARPVARRGAARRQWRAARYGMSERSCTRSAGTGCRPARSSRAGRPRRGGGAEAGDADLVAEGLDRVGARSGASQQRAAYERTGDVEGVVDDLIARTRASWEA